MTLTPGRHVMTSQNPGVLFVLLLACLSAIGRCQERSEGGVVRQGEACANPADCNSAAGGGGKQMPGEASSAKASNIAMKAAEEAKAAHDAQLQAGQLAAHQVKEQLAEKAIEAAKAAEAALSGKEAMVQQIQQEVREAEEVEQEEGANLQQSQQMAQAAMQAAQEADAETKLLTNALQLAQANAINAKQAAEGAQQSFSEREQLVEAAKSRVEQLMKELSVAKADLMNTKKSAQKAIEAAKEAKESAARNRRKSLGVDAGDDTYTP